MTAFYVTTPPEPNCGRGKIHLSAHAMSEFKSPAARYWRFVNNGPGRVETYTLDPNVDTVCLLSAGEEAVWWKGPIILHSVDGMGATVTVEVAGEMSGLSR
jgi:hypothetical protein